MTPVSCDGIDPGVYPEPGLDLASADWWQSPMEMPDIGVPAAPDPSDREGLWTVIYRDGGGIVVVNAPEPARSPVQ